MEKKRSNNRYRLKPNEILALQKIRANDIRNVLVIGDLHEPFCLDEYLDWCKKQYDLFQCNQVIFIGDIIDNHYSSYHETSADGMGGADELELSIKRIARWYKVFPDATVIIGNHDRMIMRKSQTSAIPSKWIKSYQEVLEVPNWIFTERYEQDNVQYIHGEGGQAYNKCRADLMNTVQGHMHTLAGCQHFVGRKYRVFGLQVGCGIDFSSYAMAYAKYGKKPAIGCGVVLENGTLPINLLMPL
ncbi:MAG: hypothetical protein GOVbin2006_12 [Prokaryotic dsDNA virus sp.]|nr:MAG: hypothetical protein GOVbin2006_12 [Prokaryotic dsDNA virus sp.]